MDRFATFMRLAAAAMVAAAAAGLLVLPLAALGAAAEALVRTGNLRELAEAGAGLGAMILVLNWLVVAPAVVVGTIPAFVTCGAVWAIGRRHEWARCRAAYVAAGAAAAALPFAWFVPPVSMAADPYGWVMLALLLTAGAGGGLAFRSAMGASEELVGE